MGFASPPLNCSRLDADASACGSMGVLGNCSREKTEFVSLLNSRMSEMRGGSEAGL